MVRLERVPRVAVPRGSAVAAIALALFAGLTYFKDRPPGDRSADAGFARDMATHHAQAVDMALIVVKRTDDPLMQTLATDILLTQQAQIGIMQGWLDVWDLPLAGPDAPMTWMGDADLTMPGDKSGAGAALDDGHAMDGRMPGLATDEEIAALSTLQVPEMERQFLQLMIRHHQGGVLMAAAAVERAETSQVRIFAGSIVTSQQIEITQMERMLAELGGT